MSKTILAVETSTVACSVALLYQGRIFKRYEVLPQKHAHRLLEMVDEVLTESAVKGATLDLLAYGEGPGAFTGVRIAAGVIQGLALGWDKPVVSISSLEAMAEGVFSAREQQNLMEGQDKIAWCALMDARMKEVYIQFGVYDLQTRCLHAGSVELLSPEVASARIKALGGVFIGLGDVQKEYPGLVELFLDWTDTLPSADSVARLAEQSQAQAASLQEKVPVPIYLRNHVADTIEERKLKKILNKAL
jgi:tRNA threonylcarbamoyladenosine biosynthesis protein TsaB